MPNEPRQAKKRAHLVLKLVVTALLLLLLGLGGPFLAVHALSAGRVYDDIADVPAHDVAMVMGAAIWNGEPSPYLKGRLDVALELYNSGQIKVIIVSGSISDNEPREMREYLVENGVAYSDVILDEAGEDSYDSCAHAIDRFAVNDLVVISQDYHVPRTVATCRLLGIDAIGAADTTQPFSATKLRYERRELLANIKLFLEAAVQYRPYDGQPTDEVEKALENHS